MLCIRSILRPKYLPEKWHNTWPRCLTHFDVLRLSSKETD